MNDIQIDLNSIREHLDAIEEKLKLARMRAAYNGSENTAFRNTDTNGNYTTEQWNDKIKEDR